MVAETTTEPETNPRYLEFPSTANGKLAASSIPSVYEEDETTEDPLLCGYGS